jgi:hypothetical protein
MNSTCLAVGFLVTNDTSTIKIIMATSNRFQRSPVGLPEPGIDSQNPPLMTFGTGVGEDVGQQTNHTSGNQKSDRLHQLGCDFLGEDTQDEDGTSMAGCQQGLDTLQVGIKAAKAHHDRNPDDTQYHNTMVAIRPTNT